MKTPSWIPEWLRKSMNKVADYTYWKLPRNANRRKWYFVPCLLLLSLGAQAKVACFQITLTSSATPIVPAGNIFYRWVVFQNNAAHTMRVGDSTVSASKGMSLLSGGAFYAPLVGSGSGFNLSGWNAFGTSGDVLDVCYDDGNPA